VRCVFPRRDLGYLAPADADGEQLILLALLLGDAPQLLGNVLHAGLAHVALHLGEAFHRLPLHGERVRVELV
jgi:hypothetical protein